MIPWLTNPGGTGGGTDNYVGKSENGRATSAVNRESYNYFVDASGAGPASVTVRITSLDGQQLVDTLTPPASDTSVTGGAQFKSAYFEAECRV